MDKRFEAWGDYTAAKWRNKQYDPRMAVVTYVTGKSYHVPMTSNLNKAINWGYAVRVANSWWRWHESDRLYAHMPMIDRPWLHLVPPQVLSIEDEATAIVKTFHYEPQRIAA